MASPPAWLFGFPELNGKDMAEQRDELCSQHDIWWQRKILEPHGNDILGGVLLRPAVNVGSVDEIIFFNNEDYLGMCGQGMIGVGVTLAYMGKIGVGKHNIDTP